MHLVWQSFRTGDANIYWKSFDGTSWSGSVAVTSHEASGWRPAIAIDSQDRVLVAYDSYRRSDCDVFLWILDDGRLSPEHPIADSARFEARATVAVDRQDRAWVPWDDQGPAWALDMPAWDLTATSGDWGPPAPWRKEGSAGQKVSLRYSQRIGVAVFAGGQRRIPKDALKQSPDGNFALSYEIPEMTIDASGAPRLFLRRWVPRNDGSSMAELPAAWNLHSMTYTGGAGSNFAFSDPSLEPLMEIYQGCRLSYEASGAPRAGRSDRHAAGLARSALAKGLKVGFIASSGHRSTHISYAAGPSREDIFTALGKRRAFAATDTVVLDSRAGEAITGDWVRSRTLPQLHVAVRGTGPRHSVQVIRDGVQVYTAGPAEPGTRQESFAFLNSEADAGER